MIVPDKSLGNKNPSVSSRSLVVPLAQSCCDVGTGTKGAPVHHANRRCYDGLLRTIYDATIAEDTLVLMHDTPVLDFLGQPIDRFLARARGENGSEFCLTTSTRAVVDQGYTTLF